MTTSTTSRWRAASDGYWDDAANWSTPHHPDNGSPDPADRYSALIDVTGASYNVYLGGDVTIDKLTIDSERVSVRSYAGMIQASEGIHVKSGQWFIHQSTSPSPGIRDTHLTVAEGGDVEIANGCLDNLTLTGLLFTSRQRDVWVYNDLTLDDGNLWVGGDLHFAEGDHAIGGEGTVKLYGQISTHIDAPSGATVTIEESISVTGGGWIAGSPGGYVTNRGVMSSTTENESMTVSGNFDNQGRLEAVNRGRLRVDVSRGMYQWKNNGRIVVDGGELEFAGEYDQSDFGTIDRIDGTIVLAGTVDNIGKELRLDAALGSCELAGTIVGGTVETLEDTELYVDDSAVLSEGVTLNGRLSLNQSAETTIRDGMTLNGRIALQFSYRTELVAEGPQTIDGTGEIAFTATDGRVKVRPLNGILTVGPDITIRTDGGEGDLGDFDELQTDGILNRGTISAETPGKTIRMIGAHFGNRGLVRAVDGGTVQISDRALKDVINGMLVGGRWVVGDNSTIELGTASITTNNGNVTLRGRGSSMPAIDTLQQNRGALTVEDGRDFNTAGDLDNMGNLDVGHDCMLRVGGDYIQQELGTFTIRLAGTTPGVDHGLFRVDGHAALDGTINVVLADGYAPEKHDTFDILDFQSLSFTTDVDELLVLDTLPGGLAWDARRFPTDGSLTVVPEPGTFALAIVFLLGMAMCSRRRTNPRGARVLPAILAAIVVGSIGSTTVLAVSTDVNWKNPGIGDWFDPVNWDDHLPVDGDTAYIDNGGTARLLVDAPPANLPDTIYVGYDSSGTLERTAGDWSRGPGVALGANPGSSGTYKIGGTAIDSFYRIGFGGDALIQQTGGEVTNGEIYVGSKGTIQQSGGTFRVGDLMLYGGDYELSGTGRLDVVDDLELVYDANFVQTGGLLEAFEVLAKFAEANCSIEGGEYSAGRTKVQKGTITLSGGVMDPGTLIVYPEGSFSVSGGTLAMSEYVTNSSVVSFQPGNWTLDVRANAADLANSTFADLSAASFTSRPNTLTLFPEGLDTSQFASYTPSGVVHVAGADLHVRAGEHLGGQFTITDHLIVEGSLDAMHEGAGKALDGIEVRSGGYVNLAAGELVVNDHRSGMDSGDLKVRKFYVGKSASGSFIHTGGKFDKTEIYVGYGDGGEGYYEISGDACIDASGIRVAWEGAGAGHFKQLGGKVNSGTSVGKNGKYELIDGILLNGQTGVSGHFIQTGGDHTNRTGAYIGTSSNTVGLLELRGGTHQIEGNGLEIGHYSNGYGRYIISGTARSIGDKLTLVNGVFRQEDGTAEFAGEVTLQPFDSCAGRIELVDGDFRGGRLLLDGDITRAAVFEQTAGSCTLGEMFLGGYTATAVSDAAVYELAGGKLEVTGTAKIGTSRASERDKQIAEGVLVIGNASATFGHLMVGEERGFGGSGRLMLTDPAARIRVNGAMNFGGNAVFSAVPGSSLNVGSLIFAPSAFENESTDAAALAGLGNLEVSFDSGPYVLSTMEVAGEDLGRDMAGWTLNFALHALIVGGDDVAHLQLVDTFDNQDDEQLLGEALYVRRLEVGPDSWLDLNGLNVYSRDASIDPRAIIMPNGGTITVVPEPSTLVLLCATALGLVMFRQRTREWTGDWFG